MVKKTQKDRVLRELALCPTIKSACSRAQFPRATYYRLIEKDPIFEQQAEEALQLGKMRSRDVIKSMLFEKALDGNLKAIKFWLENNDPDYDPLLKKQVLEKRNELLPVTSIEIIPYCKGCHGKDKLDDKV